LGETIVTDGLPMVIMLVIVGSGLAARSRT
jgi:hypothetical protein